MKKISCLMLLLLSSFGFCQIQNQQQPIDLNTIFVCIDTASYEVLFQNSFVKDTLFFCRENTSKTVGDDYTGKYFIGKSAVIEFFKPNANQKLGDHFGDVGIEFKTRTIDQLPFFSSKKSKTETTFFATDSLKILWYKGLHIKNKKSGFEISLLEYQNEFLKYVGLTDEEITRPMDYGEYNNILSGGKKYPRKFNTIKKLDLVLSSSDFKYLKESLLNLGAKQNDQKFLINGSAINCKIVDKTAFRVDAITVELTENISDKKLNLSKNIQLTSHQNIVEIKFNYNQESISDNQN